MKKGSFGNKKNTVLARVDKRTYNLITNQYPDVNHAELYKIMYNSSLIKLDVYLGGKQRNNDKKKK